MKIVLTNNQATAVIQALEWAQDLDNFTPSDPGNMQYQRIIDKIEKELYHE